MKHRVIPRDFQLDPMRDLPLHVDFMRLGEGATIRVNIPIHVKNAEQSPGVKRGGTVSSSRTRSRCAAAPMPFRHPSTSMSASLDINHSRHLSDITLPEGVRVAGGRDITLVTVVPPSGYAEELKAAAEAATAARLQPPPRRLRVRGHRRAWRGSGCGRRRGWGVRRRCREEVRVRADTRLRPCCSWSDSEIRGHVTSATGTTSVSWHFRPSPSATDRTVAPALPGCCLRGADRRRARAAAAARDLHE